jgi:hypothetical protein
MIKFKVGDRINLRKYYTYDKYGIITSIEPPSEHWCTQTMYSILLDSGGRVSIGNSLMKIYAELPTIATLKRLKEQYRRNNANKR